jgi:hypothetical protein
LSSPLITTLVVAAPAPLAPVSATARATTTAAIKRLLITLSSPRNLSRRPQYHSILFARGPCD